MRIDCTAACSVGQGVAPSLLTLPVTAPAPAPLPLGLVVCSLLLALASLPWAEGKGDTTSWSSRGVLLLGALLGHMCQLWRCGSPGKSWLQSETPACETLSRALAKGAPWPFWEHQQCERRGLHTSRVTSKLPAAPSQALRPQDRCSCVGKGLAQAFFGKGLSLV